MKAVCGTLCYVLFIWGEWKIKDTLKDIVQATFCFVNFVDC